MLCDSGLSFAIPIEKPEIREVDKDDLKDLKRTGVIQFEDLVIKNNLIRKEINLEIGLLAN